ncbi:CRISPR-associated endonuclease Cas1 [Maridesulfovibrio sp.]|uniref:CRISPR-associated endonuclease Cas1 n=1 Tax=Maridesulfovibrio sp. TaxID=2795000 RepID=UPI003B00AF2A
MHIPVRQFRFSFTLTSAVECPVYHGNAVRGLILAALFGEYADPKDSAHNLPIGMVPVVCEFGRMRMVAGEIYTFGINCVGDNADELAERMAVLADRLAEIGRRSLDYWGANLPIFGGNFTKLTMSELAVAPACNGIGELQSGIQSGDVTLQFVSPLKMRSPDEFSQRFPLQGNRCFVVQHFFKQLWSNINKVTPLKSFEEFAALDGVDIVHKQFVQIETPVWGNINAAIKHKRKSIEGVQGHVSFSNVPEEWRNLLWYGQFVHVGGNKAYGCGRYVLHGAENIVFTLRSGFSVFEQMFAADLFVDAFEHVALRSSAAGVDGVEPEDFEQQLKFHARKSEELIKTGEYCPQPLKGFLLDKGNGKVRAMAVPTVQDRVLQRCTVSVIGPILEQLFEHCSYGYRPGCSRQQAADALEYARQQGYNYIVDADIRSFFDCVPWDKLTAKLFALFPFEPVVDLIEQWVQSDVKFKGRTIKRSRGLPQGASISPIMANLYLDELDDALLENNYLLVRYADDFVIACKSKDAAEQAKADAKALLDSLALQLNDEKTAVTSFNAGFSYLGYLFCRSLIIEKNKSFGDAAQQSPEAESGKLENAWLGTAQVHTLADAEKKKDKYKPYKAKQVVHSFGHLKKLFADKELPEYVYSEQSPSAEITYAKLIDPEESQSPAQASDKELDSGLNISDYDFSIDGAELPEEPTSPLLEAELRTQRKRPLYLLSPNVSINLEGQAIRLTADNSSTTQTLPLKAVSHVVVVGRPRITMPTVIALSQRKVPTYFCRRNGLLQLSVGNNKGHWHLWTMQATAQGNDLFCLQMARETVSAKLHNCALLMRKSLKEQSEQVKNLYELRDMVLVSNSIDEIRGLEGTGARLYFDSFISSMPDWMCFGGRKKHPSPDPLNSLLSYGYTLLHNHVSTALQVVGLNPQIGFMHAQYGRHHALASDLQEEFRFVVDSLIISLIRRREVRAEHFNSNFTDGSTPCLIKYELLKKITKHFEKRIMLPYPFTTLESAVCRSTIMRQVNFYKKAILKGEEYKSMRIRK